MPDPIEDTQVWSSEDVHAVRRDVEEEDESGAPGEVARPEKEEGHPLESADSLREPRDESWDDFTASSGATPDLEERVQDTS
jgi:hypothetical protein